MRPLFLMLALFLTVPTAATDIAVLSVTVNGEPLAELLDPLDLPDLAGDGVAPSSSDASRLQSATPPWRPRCDNPEIPTPENCFRGQMRRAQMHPPRSRREHRTPTKKTTSATCSA